MCLFATKSHLDIFDKTPNIHEQDHQVSVHGLSSRPCPIITPVAPASFIRSSAYSFVRTPPLAITGIATELMISLIEVISISLDLLSYF